MLRRSLLTAAAVALAVLPALPGTPSASADTSSEVVLPASVPYLAPDATLTGSGGGSFAWSYLGLQRYGNAGTAHVLLQGEATPRVFPHSTAAVDGPVVLLSDVATSTADTTPPEPGQPYVDPSVPTSQTVLDTRTGARQRVVGGVALQPLDDGGWVSASPAGGVDRHAADGTVTAHVDGPDTYDAGSSQVHPTLHADTEGVLLYEPGCCGSPSRVRYVDWRTGRTDTYTLSAAVTALTDGSYAVADGPTLTRYRRSDGAVLSRRTVDGPFGVASLVITPTATAWLVSDMPYGSTLPQVALVTSPESAPATQTRLAVRLPDAGQQLALRDGGVVVQAGYTGAERGYYLVPFGGTALGQRLVATGAQPPSFLAVENDRVLWGYPHRYSFDYETREQRVGVGASAPVLEGPQRVAAAGGPYGGALRLSGDLTAAPVDLGTTYATVVLRDGVEVGRVADPSFAHQLSGDDVVLWHLRDGAWSTSVRSSLLTAAPARELVGRCALQGTRAACLDGSGRVDETDVLTGATRTVTTSPPPPGTGTADVQLDNGWALVSWQTPGYDARHALRTDAVELATGRTVTVAQPHEAAQVGGGRLAYVDVGDARAVHLLDLGTGEDTVVGAEQSMDVGSALLGLSDRQLVRVDDDARLHVQQLPEPAGRPRLLTATPVTSFGRAGLRPRVTADRPLPPGSLEVRGPDGRLVTQTAPVAGALGVLAPGWDGLLADGSRAPAGRYDYRLVLPDAVDPGDVVLTGRAVLDLVVPVLQAALPPSLSDGSTSGDRFRLRLASDDPTALFDVSVTKRGRQPDKSIAFGATRTWQRGVPAQSLVYGGVPYGTQPGSLLRFTVTARDGAGNASSRTFDVLSPYDDGASPQRYSAGWVRRADSGAFGGGLHVTTAKGATMTARATTNRVLVVGPRCPTCGRFTVSVDGRVLKTVSAAGPAGSRARLVDLHLAGAPALHDVVLRAVSGRVAVDALGLVA